MTLRATLFQMTAGGASQNRPISVCVGVRVRLVAEPSSFTSL
jgi:hypothetical protein